MIHISFAKEITHKKSFIDIKKIYFNHLTGNFEVQMPSSLELS